MTIYENYQDALEALKDLPDYMKVAPMLREDGGLAYEVISDEAYFHRADKEARELFAHGWRADASWGTRRTLKKR